MIRRSILLFFPIGDGLPPRWENGGHCGYLGPRPNPHSRPKWSKGLEGKRPRHRLPRECQANPPFGYLKGASPEISRPMDAQLVVRPGAWDIIAWMARLSQRPTFPRCNPPRQSCQPGFYITNRNLFISKLCRLRRDRKVFPMSSLSGKRLYTRETNPPFRNKSQPLLPLREEIVHSPKKLDLLSPSIKGKRLRLEKVRIPNRRNTFFYARFPKRG